MMSLLWCRPTHQGARFRDESADVLSVRDRIRRILPRQSDHSSLLFLYVN